MKRLRSRNVRASTTTNWVGAASATSCRISVRPSCERPPVSDCVTMGIPKAPSSSDQPVTPPYWSVVSIVCDWSTPMATYCLPCGEVTPAPACSAACGKPSPAAAGAATSAATKRAITIFMRRIRRTQPQRSGSDLDQKRVALTAAGADRRQAEPAAVPPQLVHHRAEDPPTTRADRMAERDSAAVDVCDLRVRAEHLHRVESNRGERLIDLDALHFADRLPRLLQRLRA